MPNHTAKMPVLGFLVLYLEITSATFGHIAEASQTYTQKDDDIYGNLTVQDIKDILGKWDQNQQRIDGSDNDLTTGQKFDNLAPDSDIEALEVDH